MLSVAASEDYDYFSLILLLPKDQVFTAATRGFRFYKVETNHTSQGGFVVECVSGETPILHTHLQITGMKALEAFRQLCRILRQETGHTKLRTYALTRQIRLAARIAGFRQTGVVDGKTWFEISL